VSLTRCWPGSVSTAIRSRRSRAGRAADHPAGARGRADRVPRPRALRTRRRRRGRWWRGLSQRLRAQDGQDDERTDGARAPRIRNASELGLREHGARQGCRAHACVGGVDHPRVPAGRVGARCRGAVGGGARRAGGLESTVARVCQDTRERYRAWCERDPCGHDLVYCYLDAIDLKLRPDACSPRACCSPGA
jgi:hypothetical protein